MARVVLAMSGGVDSSASAWLLRQQGHEVIGLFMRSGSEATACATSADVLLPIVERRASKQGCCSAADAADARRVADALDIPFHALNFREEFGRIKDYFADEYLAGRTPNPCVMCNVWLKFGKLWEFAESVGAEFIATGHYARVQRSADGVPGLFRGLDPAKDQSYVLFGIRRELLDRILFPVGGYDKAEIRDLSRQAGLRTADKPDSQEICFIPDHDYATFVAQHRGEHETAGEFVDTAGKVLGRHQGYERFTIGQRKGLGVTFGEPRYVVKIDAESRQVVLGQKGDLACSALEADRLNWLVEDVPEQFRCTAQIRYQHAAAECTVDLTGDNAMHVEFDERQYGVTPGQAVVLYDGEQVLGGGWIR
ncbi:MAG: tRNA 2-thiouridine(34) synthase MnmA [Planctomycetaceae bacterium]